MPFDVASLMFYVFAVMVLSSAVMVIGSKNPVHSVLFLILAFFNAAGLFVLIGAEYIAMTLVIVYVGAVAVLFLFVVMMLDINYEQMREGFQRYLPIGAAVAVVLFIELVMAFYAGLLSDQPLAVVAEPIPDPTKISNTQAIGNVLYTDYIYLFQVAGLILLVAMIGAIVLTLRSRPGVHKQNIARQVARRREDSVAVVQVKTGEGIK